MHRWCLSCCSYYYVNSSFSTWNFFFSEIGTSRMKNAELRWQVCTYCMINDREKACFCQRGSVGLHLYNKTWSKVVSAGLVFMPCGQNREKSRGVTVNRSWWNNWSHTQVSAHTADSDTHTQKTHVKTHRQSHRLESIRKIYVFSSKSFYLTAGWV